MGAEAAGVTTLGLVDHVRVDTTWLPDFVAAVDAVRATTEIEVLCGVEAKMLDRSGRLDLPPDLDGVDYVAIADHQVPFGCGPMHPAEVRGQLERGERSPFAVVAVVVTAMIAALHRFPRSLLVHPFSILPKVGLSEADVPDALLADLADAALRSGAVVEVSERWRCPTPRTTAVLHRAGVPLVISSDSHRSDTIGRYAYALDVVGALDAWTPPPAAEMLGRLAASADAAA
jgi:putative hydrolase